MSASTRLFRISNIPSSPTRLHSLRSKRSISDATDDIQLKRNNDLLSRQFDKLLKSSSAQSIIADQLQSDGYANQSNKWKQKSVSTPISILSHETCQILKEQTIPDLFRGHFDTNIYPDEWHWREGISRDDAAREMCNSWKSSRFVASIVLHEKIGQFVAQVMGWDSVRIGQDDIVWKTPHTSSYQNQSNHSIKKSNTVGFHQDSAYISTQFQPYENNSVTVWMALDDADEETGCMEYALRSHLWPILHRQSSVADDSKTSNMKREKEHLLSSFHNSDESTYIFNSSFKNAHLAYLEGIRDCHLGSNDVGSNDDLCEIIIHSAPVKAGNAVIHHQDIWHGSGPNKSNTRHRRALIAHYLRGDLKFVNDDTKETPFGKTSYIYGRYKKYQSAELDETFFPVIFSKSGAAGGLQRTE